jgi:hypothetical protein
MIFVVGSSSRPLVASVLIATRNRSDSLKRTLESLHLPELSKPVPDSR